MKTFSGKKVIKAGEDLINPETIDDEPKFEAAFDVLSYWRFSHENSLENAFRILRDTSLKHDRSAIFAKRLKRYFSIVNKLQRFPEMKLKNMQDIGGCRAIVSDPKRLGKIVRDLKKNPAFRSGEGKVRYKDYVKNPKNDGYRGYHLVGRFDNGDNGKRNIEVQVRTRLQHDWATTLEIVDLFTGQALKSNQGRPEWKDFFWGVSKQFALMEDIHLFEKMSWGDKAVAFREKIYEPNSDEHDRVKCCSDVKSKIKKMNIFNVLQVYSNSLKIVDGQIQEKSLDGYVLIEVEINEKDKKATVTTTLFSKEENEDAEKSYAELEKKSAVEDGVVVALVSTTAVGGIKQAYPNYFADSSDFVRHLECILAVTTSRKNILSGFFGG